jgi:uncharacterized Zn finger protein
MITLTDSIISSGTSPKVFERGEDLYKRDALSNLAIQENVLFGDCEGTEKPFYQIKVELDKYGIKGVNCTCASVGNGYCKHTVAVLLAYVYEPESFTVRQTPQELLASQSKEQLLDLIAKLLKEKPELYKWFEANLNLSPEIIKKARKTEVNIDSYRRRIRTAVLRINTGKYGQYDDELDEELDNTENSAIKFLESGDAESACQIMLTLFEENVNSFDYIDDSDGDHGDYLDRAAVLFAEMLLSLKSDEEREEYIDDIDRLYDHFSDYGVEGLQIALAAAENGWAENADFPADDFEQFQAIKLNILDRQGKDEEFLKLALATDAHLRYAIKLVELQRVDEAFEYAMKHFYKTDDALKMAKLLREFNFLDYSLQIAEKGVLFEGSKQFLAEWLAPIQETLGKNDDALQSWILVFNEKPSLTLYQKLQNMSGANWGNLQPGLMQSLKSGYWDKRALAEILLYEKNWDEALKLGNEKNNPYYGDVTNIVADGLIKHRPEWVVEISQKNFDELVRETKSKYYPKAVKWLQKAKLAYQELDKTNEWKTYLADTREIYKRRPSLISELKSL